MNILASRGAQYSLHQQFLFNFNNWLKDSVSLANETLGSTVAAATDPATVGLVGPTANTITFDCIPLPLGATIIGGDLVVETAYVGPTTATITLGTAAVPAAYLAATSVTAVGRTPILLTTPLASLDGSNVRMTLTYTGGNATAGRVRVRVSYMVDGRINEVQIT